MKKRFTIILALFLTLNITCIQVFANGETIYVGDDCYHNYLLGEWKYYDDSYHKMVWICQDCGKLLSDEESHQEITLEKHEFWDVDWETEETATIFKEGTEVRYCKKCGAKETRKVDPINPFARFKKKTISVAVKKSFDLNNQLLIGNGDSVKKWNVSKKSIATISKKGILKAKKKGKVKISVTLKSGKKATCTVIVAKAKANKVYWTPSGSVYHKSKDCPTLARSKKIKSGTIKKSKKKRCCKVCG